MLQRSCVNERWSNGICGQESSCRARLPDGVLLSRLVFGFSRLPASTRCNSNNKRVCCVVETAEGCNERSIQGGRRYQTKGMRNQCRSGGGVLWCMVLIRVSCRCVRACVFPRTTGSARVSRRWVAESKRAARERETVQVCHEQRVSGGSRPGEQTGRDWYLSETRSDVGSTGARSRLRRRAGQANLKRQYEVVGVFKRVSFRASECMLVCWGHHERGMVATVVTRGGVSLAGGADCGRWGQTGRRREGRRGQHSTRGRGRAHHKRGASLRQGCWHYCDNRGSLASGRCHIGIIIGRAMALWLDRWLLHHSSPMHVGACSHGVKACNRAWL